MFLKLNRGNNIIFSLLITVSFFILACENPLIQEIWDLKTIVFETLGGSSVPSQTLLKGYPVKKPVNPSKTGFEFFGWYREEAAVTAWDFNSVPDKSLTLYAGWKVIGLKVTPLTEHHLGVLFEGYTAADISSFAATVNVENISDEPFTADVTISGDAAAFNLTSPFPAILAPNGGNDNFTIAPGIGQSAGEYTATVTVTGGGYSFSFTVSYTVKDVEVVSVAIKTQPNLSYIHNDPLDLSLLEVTLTYNNGTAKDAVFAQFNFEGITASLADGTAHNDTLTRGTPTTGTDGIDVHNGAKIKVTHTASGNYAETDLLDVGKAPGAALTGTPTYDADATTETKIAVNPVTVPGNVQSVEYAIYNITTFNYDVPYQVGLELNLASSYQTSYTYKIYARSAANYNYEAGLTVSESANINFYQVYFFENGGTLVSTDAAKLVVSGGKVKEPVITRTGHTLEGWYKENTFATKWDFDNDTVTSSGIWLYANWEVTIGSVTVTLTVEQITEPGGSISPITLSKSGTGNPSIININLTYSDYDPGSVTWEIYGVSPSPQSITSGPIHINSNNTSLFNITGGYQLIIRVKKDGTDFAKTVQITILD